MILSPMGSVFGHGPEKRSGLGSEHPFLLAGHEGQELYGDLVETHLFEDSRFPNWYWLMIQDRRATKDQALGWLIEAHGLDGDELVVFGDQINDITMFRMAARAVAVANAHPDVKRHATRIIGSNEEDSVVKYIRDHRAQSMSQCL